MKRFAAQFVFTNSCPPLKRAVITTEDSGEIINIEETSGDLIEKHSIEFYNGVIVPGFVNCHCHLELSHMKGSVNEGTGLGEFIEQIRTTRKTNAESIQASAYSADNYMFNNGIVLCADICNTSDSFKIKKDSRIRYVNLLEVFGIDPDKAAKRIDEITLVAEKAKDMDLTFSLVPHSAYSLSLTLFRLLKDRSLNNKVTSIHFMETASEENFLKNLTGALMSSYERSGMIPPRLETPECHSSVILGEITKSGNLILIHNTFADFKTVRLVRERENLFWCLCPNSNIYIENTMPPLNMLIGEDCEIVIGTDSLASNTELSILAELKTLQHYFPDLTMMDLIPWATLNGARSLGEEDQFGTIETGKNPGLLLLQNVDLHNMKLLPESFVTRLI